MNGERNSQTYNPKGSAFQKNCRRFAYFYVLFTLFTIFIFNKVLLILFVYATLIALVVLLISFWRTEIRTIFVWIIAVSVFFSVFQTHWPLKI